MRSKVSQQAAVLALALLVLAGTAFPTATGQERGSSPSWEYRAFSFTGDEQEGTRRLNDLARHGWEYVGPLGNGLVAFKRAVLPSREAAAAKDLEMLQGTWYTVSIAYENVVTGPDRTDTFTYEGNRYIQKQNGQVYQAGRFKIVDATAHPKQIEYLCTEGGLKGKTFRSIYTLDGDRHQVCSDGANDNRPTEFSGKDGFLRVMKREKK
jgi:uncharacterized protein (TIGR03067 family)